MRVIGGCGYLERMIGALLCLSMQETGSDVTPKTPRKRTPVKRQPSVWFEPASKLSLTPEAVDPIKLQEAVNSLTRRLNSLEAEWQELLEHLSEQEVFTDCTQDEEEMS